MKLAAWVGVDLVLTNKSLCSLITFVVCVTPWTVDNFCGILLDTIFRLPVTTVCLLLEWFYLRLDTWSVQVPPDLQNEVLISLLETDPDVVDYLLRRKASQSS